MVDQLRPMRCLAAGAVLRGASCCQYRRMVSTSCIVPPRPRARGLTVLNETKEQRLSRAKVRQTAAQCCLQHSVQLTIASVFVQQGYPYARPSTCFIFCNRRAYTFPDGCWVPPSQWNGSLEPLQQLQVTAPDGTTSR